MIFRRVITVVQPPQRTETRLYGRQGMRVHLQNEQKERRSARYVNRGETMKRSEIRENMFKLIFCAEFHSSDELAAQLAAYLEEMPEVSEQEHTYIVEKFEDIKKNITEIDEKINGVAKGWKTDRMGKADLAILRLAVYEMLYEEAIPVKVAINEAVELAKIFGGDDSPAFVNGILAKLV